MTKTQVLVIGLEPNLVDFSTMPDMNAEKVRAGLEADQAKLAALGYEADLCLTMGILDKPSKTRGKARGGDFYAAVGRRPTITRRNGPQSRRGCSSSRVGPATRDT